MSVLFGTYNLLEKDNSTFFQSLQKNIRPKYFDREEGWNNEFLYLGNYQTYFRCIDQHTTSIYSTEELTITSNARFDNREELINLLGIQIALKNSIPTNILIAKAYKKWGNNCVKYFEGDWAFVLWDNDKEELFIARDQFGLTGIYYHTSQKEFTFSSRLKGITKTINNLELDDSIFIKSIIGQNTEAHTTIYKDIFQLERGHYLILKGNKLSKYTYFEFKQLDQIIYNNPSDYIDHFLELYKNAIQIRMNDVGKIGSMLSGGLDSGSTASLLARELKKSNQRLNTYTSIPKYDSRHLTHPQHFGDETFFSKSTAQFHENIDQYFVNGTDISLIEGLRNHVVEHALPSSSPSNTYWIQEILLNAQKHGIKTLFGGFAGNATISWNHHQSISFFDKLKQKDISIFEKINFIKSVTLNKLIPTKQYNSSNHTLNNILLSIINQELIEKFIDNSSPGRINNQVESSSTYDKRINMLSTQRTNIGNFWQESGYQYGINIVDATRDLKLTNFCLSLPDDLFINRYLLRESMCDILPENVRNNRKRGRQSSDAQLIVQKNCHEFQNLISKFEEIPLVCQYIDIRKLKESLSKFGSTTSLLLESEFDITLLKGISVGIFIEYLKNKEK